MEFEILFCMMALTAGCCGLRPCGGYLDREEFRKLHVRLVGWSALILCCSGVSLLF